MVTYEKLRITMADATKELKVVISLDDQLSRKMPNITGSVLKADLAFAGIAKTMELVKQGFTKLTGFFKQGLQVAGDLESARQGFKALLGSAEEADSVMKRIKDEAKRTPFELQGLTEGALALSVITKDGNKAVDTLLDVGKAVSMSGKGNYELERVIYNLQQVQSTGKLTAIDLKEFRRAIPIFDQVTQSIGMTGEEIQNAVNPAEKLMEAFRKAGEQGGVTFEGFSSQAGTFNQLMGNLKDSIAIGSSELVKNIGLFDLAKNVIGNVTSKISGFTEKVGIASQIVRNDLGGSVEVLSIMAKQLGKDLEMELITKIVNIGNAIKGLVQAFKTGDFSGFTESLQNLNVPETVTTAITTIVTKLREFGEWVADNKDMVISFLEGLAIALGGLVIISTIGSILTTLTNPLFLIITAIGLLKVAWDQNFLGIRDTTKIVVDAITGFFKAHEEDIRFVFGAIKQIVETVVQAISTFWEAHGQQMMESARILWETIKGIIGGALQIIGNIIKLICAVLTGDWDKAWEAVKGILNGAVTIVKSVLNGLWTVIKNIFIGIKEDVVGEWKLLKFQIHLQLIILKNNIEEGLGNIMKSVVEWAGKIKDKISGAFNVFKKGSPSIFDTIKEMVNVSNKTMQGIQVPDIKQNINQSISQSGGAFARPDATNNNTVSVNFNGDISVRDDTDINKIAEAVKRVLDHESSLYVQGVY